MPAGIVMYYIGDKAPSGWLICDGSAISKSDYNDLYLIIGDRYGSTDTTFNLPTLTDNRFIEGTNSDGIGAALNPGLPNITGHFSAVDVGSHENVDGAFKDDGDPNVFQPIYIGYEVTSVTGRKDSLDMYISVDASRESSVYGASSTVQPKALTLLPIIKY